MRDFISWNEEMADKYNPESYYKNANFIIRYVENKRIRLVERMLIASKRDRVLEVGCGAGNILERIRRGRVIGIDISERMLIRAKLRLSKNEDAILIRADAERLPFYDKLFDKVIASEVLEHTEHPEIVLLEIGRVVKNGGTLLITIPNEPLINDIKKILDRIGIFNLCFKGIPKAMDEEWHLHSFHLGMLKRMIPSNFKIQKVRAVPFWFLPLRFCVLLSVNLQ